MRNTLYRYNSQTCQYERVRLSAGSVLWYLCGVVITGSLMLVCILVMYDRIVNTEAETRLRRENKALRDHHEILSDALIQIQPTLTSLQNRDHAIHARFFGTSVVSPDNVQTGQQEILLEDAKGFRSVVHSLRETSGKLITRSAGTNRFFSTHINLSGDALKNIQSLPTGHPIARFHEGMVISGYGLRVNPFHKGLYDHPGIDLAAPRGTEVLAAGSGRVAEVKSSELQAGYGNYVDIDHGQGLVTRYAHLEETRVKFGERIKKGDVIGTVGTSGGSIAPHLHYEVIRNNRNTDPVCFLVENITSEQHAKLVSIARQQNQSLD